MVAHSLLFGLTLPGWQAMAFLRNATVVVVVVVVVVVLLLLVVVVVVVVIW